FIDNESSKCFVALKVFIFHLHPFLEYRLLFLPYEIECHVQFFHKMSTRLKEKIETIPKQMKSFLVPLGLVSIRVVGKKIVVCPNLWFPNTQLPKLECYPFLGFFLLYSMYNPVLSFSLLFFVFFLLRYIFEN
ncbi:hypothetical protein HMI55_004211, partial [Coelomomyces lativittatus]